MPSEYTCPNCQSNDVIEFEDFVECQQCGRIFFRESFYDNIDDEDRLTEEDLHEFVDNFKELKDEKTRKRFLKSLDEDLKDLDR